MSVYAHAWKMWSSVELVKDARRKKKWTGQRRKWNLLSRKFRLEVRLIFGAQEKAGKKIGLGKMGLRVAFNSTHPTCSTRTTSTSTWTERPDCGCSQTFPRPSDLPAFEQWQQQP